MMTNNIFFNVKFLASLFVGILLLIDWALKKFESPWLHSTESRPTYLYPSGSSLHSKQSKQFIESQSLETEGNKGIRDCSIANSYNDQQWL